MTGILKNMALVGTVALIAGCASNNKKDDTPASFDTLTADAVAMADGLVDLDTGAPIADEMTDLPDTGSAEYTGYIGGLMDGDGFIGELTLNVDFDPNDSGSITGGATGFQHEVDGAYTGSLVLGLGSIIPGLGAGDADLIAGDLTGTLQNDGSDYDTTIALDGAFFGAAPGQVPTAVGGIAFGEVGAGADNFDGAFIAN